MKVLRVLIAVVIGAIASMGCANTFTVTSTGPGESTGTLNWAMTQANADLDLDTINFNISSGAKVINGSSLPSLSSPMIINGSSQPGFSGTPAVTISFSGYPYEGFSIYYPGSTISDLCILGSAQTLIGVHEDNTQITNCWVGINPAFDGIHGETGIKAGDYSTLNHIGITHCLIANQQTGIQVHDCQDVLIKSCAIGTDFTGTQTLFCGGSGIEVIDTTDITIGPIASEPGNIIANCGGDGVATLNSPTALILGNRIFNCGQSAIDFGMDGTSSNFYQNSNIPGGMQNTPRIETVVRANGNIQIAGTLGSEASKKYIVELYASKNPNGPVQGQGEFNLGSVAVNTDASGDSTFSTNIPDVLPVGGDYVFSGTATRFDKSYGTSEFSPWLGANFAFDVIEEDPTADPGWTHSGVDSGPEYTLDPDSPDDVDVSSVTGELQTIVRPSSGRFRIAGWTNPSIMTASNPAGIYYRGKFYIYTSNAAGAPLNTVPNFRIRLEDEGVILASNGYSFAATGESAPPQEPLYGTLNNPDLEARAGQSLKPSSNPSKPSLYRVDFLPPPSPSQIGSHIGATFESYSTEDPANGTLSLTEFAIASYIPNSSTDTTISLVYAPDSVFTSVLGVSTSAFATTSFGTFNAENDFRPGRRQALDLPGEVPSSDLAQMDQPPGDVGVMIDSAGSPADRFSVGLFNVTANNNADMPRIRPGRLYAGVFVVASDMPAEPALPGDVTQGGMQFQLQTAGGALTCRCELSGPANFAPAGSRGRQMLDELLPGPNSINPLLANYEFLPGEGGGAFVVLMSTPLDPDIRQDVGGALGPLGAEPGPGVNLPSMRDISIGVNIVKQPETLRFSDTLVAPWAPPNRAKIRLCGIALEELPQINDGGYPF